MKKIMLCLLILINGCFLTAQDRLTGHMFATRSEVIAVNGMAATSQPLATQVAIDILKAGGNAIDAAIAANAMLCLVEPTGCGIGGDLFAIVWDASAMKLYGLNASGRSPYELTAGILKKNNPEKIPAHGPLPVSVPGCVDGWFELHNRFGELPMDKILQASIDYANNGFPVSELIAYYMERNAMVLKDYPGFKELFMPGGKTPAKGDIFKNQDLASTLSIIANKGRDAFYKGLLAEIIAETVQEQGGYLSLKDLQDHQSEWVEPVSVNYRGYDVWELPPNGQGTAVLQMLNILEDFDIASMGFGSREYLHLLCETKKVVFEDRAKFYADPAFNDIPIDMLLSKAYADERRSLINLERAGKSFDAGELENGNTIYLTVADKSGNMVSLIQSNYRGMGSGIIPKGLGFILQDRGELFSLEEGHFNYYQPHKRPFHTIIPGFVTRDGQPFLSFGVMGGAMQPQGHVQLLVNLIDFGMNIQEASDAPRIRHEGSSQPTGERMTNGGILNLESGFSAGVLRELDKMGHTIGYSTGGYGGCQAIMRIKGVYYGASESRKDGMAVGY